MPQEKSKALPGTCGKQGYTRRTLRFLKDLSV